MLLIKPPKRRAAANKAAAPVKRPSRLAKEHGLTAAQEAEIREAFGLFAIQHPDHEDSKEGVIRRDDVRRCLISLNLGPQRSELAEILSTIDPLNTGFVPFEPFFSYAAIAMHSQDEDEDEEDDGDGEDDEEVYRETSNMEEVRAAYKLFTHGGPGPITLAHLRRVAKELREDVPEELLRDMIREANGAAKGNPSVGGVGLEEFENVMRRAGMSF
ncbi:EF-hand superfamily Ca2+-modulated protein [Sporormia fimetaria CBS 119925]|uniref:Calmodulin n=1 Tax=Sporormia fimetaria CBS 119925 TaxID=1340428 RepID=A0A6A6V0Z0_9PLEO|nr:EF-hand superfamily Ca2+-modulated protein [Sporormia fimetaria CBS 119925]